MDRGVVGRALVASVTALVIAVAFARIGYTLVPPRGTTATFALRVGVLVVALPVGVVLADALLGRLDLV